MSEMSANDLINLIEEMKETYTINITTSPEQTQNEKNRIFILAYDQAIKVKNFVESKDK